MGNPRIAYLNRWRTADLYSIYERIYSHPEFPIEHTQGDMPSDFWRTRYGANTGLGRFQITANTANLDFQVYAPTEDQNNYTVTISTGSNYNGQSLAAEIQTKLRASGTYHNNFSVLFSESTGIFTIDNPDALDLRLHWLTGNSSANGTNTCIGKTIGFDVSANDTGNNSYTADYRRNYYPSTTVRGDLGANTNINCVALIRHNIDANSYAWMQGSDSNNLANYEAFTVVGANNAIQAGNHFIFAANTYTHRYWRIVISDYTNPHGYTQCGLIFLGRWFELNRPPTGVYEEGRVDPSELAFSDTMSAYSLERPRLDTWTYSWRGLSDRSANTILSLMDVCGTHKPWVFCRDGNNYATTSKLVRLTDLQPMRREYNDYWSWRMTIQEVL